MDPKLPTYGGTIGKDVSGESDGLSVLIGWDTTPDAKLAVQQYVQPRSKRFCWAVARWLVMGRIFLPPGRSHDLFRRPPFLPNRL